MTHFVNDFVFNPALRAHRVFALRAHCDPYTPKVVNNWEGGLVQKKGSPLSGSNWRVYKRSNCHNGEVL